MYSAYKSALRTKPWGMPVLSVTEKLKREPSLTCYGLLKGSPLSRYMWGRGRAEWRIRSLWITMSGIIVLKAKLQSMKSKLK